MLSIGGGQPPAGPPWRSIRYRACEWPTGSWPDSRWTVSPRQGCHQLPCLALGRPPPSLGLGVLQSWTLEGRLRDPHGGGGDGLRVREYVVTSTHPPDCTSHSGCFLSRITGWIFLQRFIYGKLLLKQLDIRLFPNPQSTVSSDLFIALTCQSSWVCFDSFLVSQNFNDVYKSLHGDGGFHGGSVVKNLPVNAGDMGLIPESGRSPGEGNGNPFQSSCLRNPIDRGAWWVSP